MNNRTNITCLLLAVAGLSFGIGQSVGEDRAEAGAQSAKVLKVRDAAAKTYLQYIFRVLINQSDTLRGIENQLTLTQQPGPGEDEVKTTARGLLRQICVNTEPNGFAFKC